MTDHITPETQALIDRAQLEMKQENWHDAAETLADLYESLQTFDINNRLVTALFMDKQYQLASSYADDFLAEYLDDETHFRMIVALAVQNQSFVYAQQLAMLWDDEQTQSEILDEIRTAENHAKETMATTLATISRQFYHMSDYDLDAQRNRYEAARRLPVADFVIGAKFLLVDPFALPLIRATLLEDLQKLDIQEPVQYRWLDEQLYTIRLDQINPLTSSEVFEKIATLIDDRLGQEDPVALEMLAHQMRLELTLLYPQTDDVIIDADSWVDSSLDRYYGQSNHTEVGLQKYWHDKVNEITNSFFEN